MDQDSQSTRAGGAAEDSGDVAASAEVTRLLQAAANGDGRASADLLPLVYDALRKLAGGAMRHEPAGMTLQPTALVHEAYLRLVGGGDVRWENRGHFFGAAALAMRRLLVERARQRARIKHGGGRQRVELTVDLDEAGLREEPETTDLLLLEPALESLKAHDARQYEVVMLRYFAGLSVEQTAACLGVSGVTVKRDWTVARARLRRDMERRLAEAPDAGRDSPESTRGGPE